MDSDNQHLSYEDLVNKSKQFFRNNKGAKVMTSANLIENLSSYSETIEAFANKAYPVIHESMVTLIKDFLTYKREHGSRIEKDLYKEMSLVEFVDRLITKRPLAFLTAADSWLTRSGEYGAGGWGEIGTEEEGETYNVLGLADFMSYDEVKVAALLQLSSPVVTINNGSRDNIGRPGEDFLDTGVYVGAVGARFEIAGRMEYQDMLVTQNQNTEENGYGENNQRPSLNKVFAKFYGMENFHEFSDVKKHENLYKESQKYLRKGRFLNKEIYTKRIQITAETFLLEAEQRGVLEDRDIYCHVVGLGLGVWQIHKDQNKYFLRAWVRAIEQLNLTRVKTINFSWIATCPDVPQLVDKKSFKGINILFSRRNPFDLLPDAEKPPLVVAMFAWDGNSFVGNEYWQGHLSASGDPAAAACSTIPEMMNPDINTSNIRGKNTRVATRSRGLVTISEYLGLEQ